jgi:uncharacterized protein YecT (DUF1311 family)
MNRSSQFLFSNLLLAIGLTVPAHSQIAEPTLSWQDYEARAERICQGAATYKPGPLETATAEDRKRFADPSASCMSFLFGEAEDRDYDLGRRCCLTRHCNRELAMIFANGWGVPRDYDAATWFLCRAAKDNAGQELNPVELGKMLAAVQEMRTSDLPQDLDYCGHIATSGVAAAYCEGLAADAEAPRQKRRIAAVADSLGSAARAALADLQTAENAFGEAESDLRTLSSRGGTGYAGIRLNVRRELAENFLWSLEALGCQRAPSALPAAFRDGDRDLNEAYQTASSAFAAAKISAPGRPLPEILQDAQRAWLGYRDAWTAFYRLRWQGAASPEILDREIQMALTRQRTAELRELTAGE